jgi:hypothetical protein
LRYVGLLKKSALPAKQKGLISKGAQLIPGPLRRPLPEQAIKISPGSEERRKVVEYEEDAVCFY